MGWGVVGRWLNSRESLVGSRESSPEVGKTESPEGIQIQVRENGSREVRKEEKNYLI